MTNGTRMPAITRTVIARAWRRTNGWLSLSSDSGKKSTVRLTGLGERVDCKSTITGETCFCPGLTSSLVVGMMSVLFPLRFGGETGLSYSQSPENVENVHDCLILGQAIAADHNRQIRGLRFCLAQPLLELLDR